jgi:uncharacterized protein YndB with AHSA1/START domain
MATRQQSPVTLQLRRAIRATPARVFQAWTTPAEMKKWKAPGDLSVAVAEVDLRVGGRYRVHMRAPDGTEHRVGGTYRVVDPPRKLVYTWLWDTNPDMGETVVTVEFRDLGGSTEVVLTHELFPTEADRKEHEMGWTGSFEKLDALLAGTPA